GGGGPRAAWWRGHPDVWSVQVMLYRTAGQFKTSYAADHALFPVRQDAWLLGVILVFAFVIFPFTASEFAFNALLVPVLIYSLAALGLNILTGYAGQLSLGTGA